MIIASPDDTKSDHGRDEAGAVGMAAEVLLRCLVVPIDHVTTSWYGYDVTAMLTL